MKKIIGALCVLLALGVAWYVFTDGTFRVDSAKKKLVRQAQDAVINNADPEDVAALAMKAITLTQGEHGAELWRLKADWGNMRRRDNVMELEKPRFTYYMPPDNKSIAIASDKGEIEQEKQKIRFLESVVATYEDRTLLADEVLYMGKSREILCPQGGRVEGEGYEGRANRVVWHLNSKILEAFGDVDIVFDSENDIFASPRGAEETQTPPAQSSAPAGM